MTKAFLLAAVAALSLPVLGGVQAATNRPLPPLATPERAMPAPAAEHGSFTFVAGGDNRAAGHGDPMPPSTQEIFQEIGLIRPDFVIWTGDSIEGYDDSPAEADGEYASFLNLAKLAGVPVFSIPGNHEIPGDPALIASYTADMGPIYGSFDYEGSHFIGLDTAPLVDGKVAEGSIDPDQLAWLKDDLETNKNAANIFVFFHHFMFGPADPDVPGLDTGFADPKMRDMLHELFAQYHVRAVFNGHGHESYHTVKDGVAYYIAGNAGAPMDQAPENGGYLGYLLVTVTGSEIAARNMIPWTLIERSVSGADGKSRNSEIALSSYSFSDVTMRGISVRMPQAKSYVVTAETRYKGKSKTVPAAIDRITPGPHHTELVSVKLEATHARTTYITIVAAK